MTRNKPNSKRGGRLETINRKQARAAKYGTPRGGR